MARALALCATFGAAAAIPVVPARGRKVGMGPPPPDPGPAKFINNDAIIDHLPKAPETYPDNLRGVIWMDQTGFFGWGNLTSGAPDLALSFGDTKYSTLNTETHEVSINVGGPAWQWMNNKDGYKTYRDQIVANDYRYDFVWNADYTAAQIYPVADFGLFGTHRVSDSLVSFTIERQTPPPGATCPPAAGATREEKARCAKWRRVSKIFTAVPFISAGIGTYYYFAYEIIDKDGNKVQPYYDAYLAFANSNCQPDAIEAKQYGFDLGTEGLMANSSFLGTYIG